MTVTDELRMQALRQEIATHRINLRVAQDKLERLEKRISWWGTIDDPWFRNRRSE